MENSFITIKENCPSHRIQLDMTFKSYTLSIPTLFYPTNQKCTKANCAHVAAVLSIIFGRSSEIRKVRTRLISHMPFLSAKVWSQKGREEQ
jgi:hypothetical protein